MQAGKQRSSLPLMRRFNEHSEKLLRSYTDAGLDAESDRFASTGGATGDPLVSDGPHKRAKTERARDELRRAELDFEDLHASQGAKEIPLDMEMQDRQKYFEGRSGGGDASSSSVVRRDQEVRFHSASGILTQAKVAWYSLTDMFLVFFLSLCL